MSFGNAVGRRSGYEVGSVNQFTPQQQQLFSQLFSHVGPNSYLSKLAGGDQSLFADLEAPALQQFAGLQGNIASRFSGMGSGTRRSSGFQNTMNQAASDFAQQLRSQRVGLQNEALERLASMSNILLGQRPSENFLMPKKPSFLESILGATGQGLGQAGGMGGGIGFLKLLGLV